MALAMRGSCGYPLYSIVAIAEWVVWKPWLKMNPHRLAAVGTVLREMIEAARSGVIVRAVALAASNDQSNGVLRRIETREHGSAPPPESLLTLQRAYRRPNFYQHSPPHPRD